MNVVHSVGIKKGSDQVMEDILIIGQNSNLPNVAGASAGASVTTPVVFGDLPGTNYGVTVTPNQDAVCYVTGKTSAGFNVVMSPRLATNTLAAGFFDVLLTA